MFLRDHTTKRKDTHFFQIENLWVSYSPLAQGELEHSLFYLGNGKYINKHGGGEIYFQDLRCAQKKYPSDSVRIIRISPDYYSSENVFKRSYHQKEGHSFFSN